MRNHESMVEETEMQKYYPLTDSPQLQICLTGSCNCASASECKFNRCKNCDMPADADGKTLTDYCGSVEVYENRICPDCGSVLPHS